MSLLPLVDETLIVCAAFTNLFKVYASSNNIKKPRED